MRPRGVGLALLLAALVSCSSNPPAPVKDAAAPATPSYFVVNAQTAATITGRVTFKGVRPRRQAIRIDEDLGCVQLNKSGLLEESVIVHGLQAALANVFIYVKKGLEGKQFAPPPAVETVTMNQKRCRFGPHVLGIRAGQTLRVTNSDPLTHNIHPQARLNREWNQSQEPGSPALERKFVRPEIMVRVKCNVHSWMRAYVGVVEHPYFAVTGEDGTFAIPNLPPGDYTIEAWQEKLGVQELAVHVEPSAQKPVAFTFTGG